MGQPEEQKPPAPPARKQTPRVPSNVLYDRIVPIALVVILIVLAVTVLMVIVVPLLGIHAG